MNLERPIPAALINSLPGLEVHATILLNLLRGEWLTRMPENWEIAIVIIAGRSHCRCARGLAPVLRGGLDD